MEGKRPSSSFDQALKERSDEHPAGGLVRQKGGQTVTVIVDPGLVEALRVGCAEAALGMSVEKSELSLELLWGPEVIRVEEGDQIGAREPGPEVTQPRQAGRVGDALVADARIADRSDDGARAVRRAVVEHQ